MTLVAQLSLKIDTVIPNIDTILLLLLLEFTDKLN